MYFAYVFVLLFSPAHFLSCNLKNKLYQYHVTTIYKSLKIEKKSSHNCATLNKTTVNCVNVYSIPGFIPTHPLLPLPVHR